MKVTEIANAGDDVLLVKGEDDAGQPVEAYGWVSATTNHYDQDAYAADGHLREDATPRRMTGDETFAYALQLLEEANR